MAEAVHESEGLRVAGALFELAAASFPALAQVEAEMRKLAIVYELYAAHADAVEAWSRQLWADLNVGSMITAMEATSEKLQAAKAQLGALPAFEALSREVGGFAASLPLMKDLKSEALRWGWGPGTCIAGGGQ